MTDAAVYYIRTKSGDEFMATILEHTTQWVIVENPMVIENLSDDAGTQMMFLSRFVPFAKDSAMSYPRDDIVFILTCTDLVTEYYYQSLSFCRLYVDRKFNAGIVSAIKMLNNSLAQLTSETSLVDDLMHGDGELEAEDSESEIDSELESEYPTTVSYKPTFH